MKHKIILLGVMIFFCLFLNGWFSLKPNKSQSFFMEEAIPIREGDEIVGMDYYITLPSNYYSDGLLQTRLLDSIYHYKDVQDVSHFLIRIHFKNLTSQDYILKDYYVDDLQVKKYYTHSDIIFSSKHSSVFSFYIDFHNFSIKNSSFIIKIQ